YHFSVYGACALRDLCPFPTRRSSDLEAGILRRIRDEAVVGYEGLLQDEQGRSFLVMGFIDGPSLAERAQSRPLSTEEAMRLLDRSEEHTSELQSRENLVCRLLLEKKK